MGADQSQAHLFSIMTSHAKWQNMATETVYKQIKQWNTNILYDATSKIILAISNALVVLIVSVKVLNSEFSIGMMVAYLSLKTQLEQRSLSILEIYLSYRMLDVHLERVSDITDTTPEIVEKREGEYRIRSVRLSNVCYAYSAFESDVISNLTLTINEGEYVAIVGPSGIGKSTLLKLITGLIQPSSGQIAFKIQPDGSLSPEEARNGIGVVLQDDTLFAGTIGENISNFDEMPDQNLIEEVSRAAQIDTDIKEMPMSYETLVGDMGANLSSGQIQRILIARALYRKPKLMEMDEGTRNLDLATEAAVNKAIQSLPLTRIIAAHRPETIATADRIYMMSKGTL